MLVGGIPRVLKRSTPQRVQTNACFVQVPVPTVVAGDIVVLGTGDVVPADLRLFEAKDFKARGDGFSLVWLRVVSYWVLFLWLFRSRFLSFSLPSLVLVILSPPASNPRGQ